MSSESEAIASALDNASDGGLIELVSTFDDPPPGGISTLLDPDAECIFVLPDAEPPPPGSAVFRGRDGYFALWREWLQPYETAHVRNPVLHDLGDGRLLLEIRGTACLRDSNLEVELDAAVIYTMTDGRITRTEHYLGRAQALRAANDPRD